MRICSILFGKMSISVHFFGIVDHNKLIQCHFPIKVMFVANKISKEGSKYKILELEFLLT